MPNSISVSGSVLHMMKLWANLKSAILSWSAIIPSAVRGDPSAVFYFVMVAYIGVLKLLSIAGYVEYLMRDIAAPESIIALYHLPVCAVIVGQSMIGVTVTWSLKGSPHCSWESLLGDISTSLKFLILLLSHRSNHLSCSSQFAGLLLYNILLPVNCYIGSIPINVIAKTMNNIMTSYGYFIRSLGHCNNP